MIDTSGHNKVFQTYSSLLHGGLFEMIGGDWTQPGEHADRLYEYGMKGMSNEQIAELREFLLFWVNNHSSQEIDELWNSTYSDILIEGGEDFFAGIVEYIGRRESKGGR